MPERSLELNHTPPALPVADTGRAVRPVPSTSNETQRGSGSGSPLAGSQQGGLFQTCPGSISFSYVAQRSGNGGAGA